MCLTGTTVIGTHSPGFDTCWMQDFRGVIRAWKRGAKTLVSDVALVEKIRAILAACPFPAAEG